MPTVPIANGCRYADKADGPGAPHRRRQGHRGRTLPPSPNPWEGMKKRRMKIERSGK
jgi:hypothetical protein